MTDNANARTRRSAEELAAAWEHLLYEIKMLFGTARALHNLSSGKSEERRMWAVRNALTESFSVHARRLIEILYPSEPGSDDVLAEDFFDNPAAWTERRPDESPLLRAVQGDADRHVSFARLDTTPEPQGPEAASVARDLRTALRAFLAMAPVHWISDESRLYALSIMADEIPAPADA